jgi:predicted ester cyclase
MTQVKEQNKEVVREMLKALERQDSAALEEHPGLYETRKYHPIWQKAFKDLRYNVEQMIADGDLVATRLTLRGKHTGPFMGVAPTGMDLNLGVLMMDRVVDGQIVEHWANADWITVLRQLELIPPPPEMPVSVTTHEDGGL